MVKNTHIQIRISSELKEKLEKKVKSEYTTYSEYITRLIVKDLKGDANMELSRMEDLVREVVAEVYEAHGIEDYRDAQQSAVDTIDYQGEKGMTEEEFKEQYRTWVEENTPWDEI